MSNKFVEIRITVGSLVLARITGLFTWPAMVDNDPGHLFFFGQGSGGGNWMLGPVSQYHVVFFDAKEKVITRARMSDKRLVFIDKKKMGRNERLACEMARQQEERIVRRGGESSVWEPDLKVLGDIFPPKVWFSFVRIYTPELCMKGCFKVQI